MQPCLMRGVLVVSVARSPNAKVSDGIFFINGEGIERLGGGFWAGWQAPRVRFRGPLRIVSLAAGSHPPGI